MKVSRVTAAIFFSGIASSVAFTYPASKAVSNNLKTSPSQAKAKSSSLFPQPRSKVTLSATAALTPNDSSNSNGLFTFKTKYGYLNPFAIWYGFTAIALGLPWYVALTIAQLLYKITNNKIDKMKRIPIALSQIWGEFLLTLTASRPEIVNKEILDNFMKEGRAGMFVANHNSWMDIPFVGVTLGWRNYKLISKAELGKVPILGKAIRLGGHVMVDRSNRKSQLLTFKAGMQWLKDGVHLAAFPEGTRSKTGRLLPFKAGAYKMAQKVGAPIIPMSIVKSGEAHPADWMFPRQKSAGLCKIVIHEPVETKDRDEKEVEKLVRQAIIDGLPEDQRPLGEE